MPLAVLVLVMLWVASTFATHDPTYPLAGEWKLHLPTTNENGTATFKYVSPQEGRQKIAAIGGSDPCSGDAGAQYYAGDWSVGSGGGPFAGCVRTSDHRFKGYYPTGGGTSYGPFDIDSDVRSSGTLSGNCGSYGSPLPMEFTFNRHVSGDAPPPPPPPSPPPPPPPPGQPPPPPSPSPSPPPASPTPPAQRPGNTTKPAPGSLPFQLATNDTVTATQAFILPPVRRCVSRRNFVIRLRRPPKVRYLVARVRVNGKPTPVFIQRERYLTIKGQVLLRKRLAARVDLRGLPKGQFVTTIQAVTGTFRTITGTRRYRTCAGKQNAARPRL